MAASVLDRNIEHSLAKKAYALQFILSKPVEALCEKNMAHWLFLHELSFKINQIQVVVVEVLEAVAVAAVAAAEVAWVHPLWD